ncbi:MAG TPA: extracellular solute-binding protein [Anaerolineales bacterium]|nr:extracellular solute-binding protein [Anaerolineales bacterium]
MLELNLSLIGNVSTTLVRLIENFQIQQGVRVRIRSLDWETAWHELVDWALHTQGPDVSQVGSTWTGSLVALNGLRPFTHAEVRELGGSAAFFPQIWQSVVLPNQPEAWAVPWSAFTFVLCYRRDLLEKAGIDESTAFLSLPALARTVEQLHAAGVQCPWLAPVSAFHLGILHMAASFVWGMGGDFVSPTGSRLTFTQPAALEGLRAYFNLLRYLPPDAQRLDGVEAERYFTSGQAAMMMFGIDRPYEWLRRRSVAPAVLLHLGVTSMPGVPWLGGNSLVVWGDVQASSERERAALALVRHLTSREAQGVYCQGVEVFLPTRPDVLDSLPLPDTSVTRAAIQSLQTGRSYRSLPAWGKLEHQFAEVLGLIGADVTNGMGVDAALQRHLEPLARRLQATFGR